MRARTIGCGLLMAGLALVPVGCGKDAAGSSSGSPAEAAAHAEHAGIALEAAAPSTSAAPSRLDIVATEYEWSGLPDELPAGSYPVSFRNDGTQMHEISIFRNPEHLSLQELFGLGPVGIKGAVEMAGTLISGPGAAADQELTVTLTPGEYEVVCFIPATSDGKPHFSHGMHRTLEVR